MEMGNVSNGVKHVFCRKNKRTTIRIVQLSLREV